MRPIKFRAWDKDNKRMVSLTGEHYTMEDPFVGFNGQIYLIQDDGEENLWLEETEQFELMQSTGLLDKNGKEIYEGDIVQVYGRKVEIIFDNGSFRLYGKTENRKTDRRMNYCAAHFSQVIGNIYENPELLKT